MAKKRRRNNNKKKKEENNNTNVEETKEDTYKTRGNKAFMKGDHHKALEFYTKAISEDEKDHVLYSNRSGAFYSLKEYIKSLKDSEIVIMLRPDWAKGYLRKGMALEKLLKYTEAIDVYKIGLEKDTENVQLLKAIADLTVILKELNLTREQLKGKENPDGDVFEKMCQWLIDGGAQFPELYLRYYAQDYRGVHCLTKIPQDKVILYIPHDYIMTSEVAKSSEVGKKILKSNVDLRSKHSFLASYLLQEKHNPKSRWRRYLDILPQKYETMPIFFGPDLLKLLKGSFSLNKISDRIDSLKAEYDNICRHVPDFKKFKHEEFVWARLVVITRIFGLHINKKKTDGLVPYADMLNHKRPRETKWTYSDERSGFTITSLRTLGRGEQVFDSYGRKCNSRFFVNYGFSLDDNEDNEAVLALSIPKNVKNFVQKLKMVGGRDPSDAVREFQIPASYKEKKTKEAMSFLRFAYAEGSQIMNFGMTDGFKIDETDPIGIANEKKVLLQLQKAAKIALAKFPDSLEHDEKLIADGVDDFNIRNCIIMRRGEKRVLHWFINLADICIPLLELQWKDLKRKAAKCKQDPSDATNFYITSVVCDLVKFKKM